MNTKTEMSLVIFCLKSYTASQNYWSSRRKKKNFFLVFQQLVEDTAAEEIKVQSREEHLGKDQEWEMMEEMKRTIEMVTISQQEQL